MMAGKEFLVRGEIIQKSDALQVITLSIKVIEQGSEVICAEGKALVKVRETL